MGKTRVSVRTLPSGERVRHYPPDDEHPEGKMVLIQDEDTLIAQAVSERQEQNAEGLRDLRTLSRAKVEMKQEADAAYPAVPPEKRFI